MNMLSGRRVSLCDKHQFRAKVTVFEISSLNVVGFRYCYFCILLSSEWLFGNYISHADHKALKEEGWVLK